MLYSVVKLLSYAVLRLWCRLRAVGVDRVPRDGPLLVAANHASVLDPPVVGSPLGRQLHYLAKAELFDVPVLGALIRRLNAHPVDRTGSDATALRQALRLLAEGHALLVFPEGTRGTESTLREGRAGIGMLASLSGAPVVPVYVAGTGRALPKGAGFPRPVRVRVAYGTPITFPRERGKGRYQEISDEIMAAIGRLKDDMEREGRTHRRPSRTDPQMDPTTPGRSLAGRIH